MAGGSRDASSSRLIVCIGSAQGDVLVFFHELAHVLCYVACVSHGFEYARAHGIGVFR